MITPDQEPITTPIHVYTHPNTDNQVDLVGMIHIGQPSYYNTIQGFLDDRDADGAVIQYEMIKRNTPQELAAAGSLVTAKSTRLASALHGIYGIFDGLDLGLVKQKEALKYHSHWQNNDVTEIDLASRLSSFSLARHLGFMKLATAALKSMDTPELQQKKIDLLFKALHETDKDELEANDMFKRVVKAIIVGSLDDTILDYRNDVALRGYDQQIHTDPESDVVLIWGAGHLKGLGAGLVQRGFRKVHEQRVVAIQPVAK